MEKTVSPWSVPVSVDQIPEAGLHMEIEAPESVLPAIAKLAGVREVPRLSAVFNLARRGAGVLIDGQVSARVGQTCVVSLEPMESDIAETVELRFMPQLAAEEHAADLGDGHSAETDEEPPEPLIGGRIDLGAIATEFLVLGIDPYPRKAGAEFKAPKVDDAGPHPFAALGALKKEPGGGQP